mgnify:FL=1
MRRDAAQFVGERNSAAQFGAILPTPATPSHLRYNAIEASDEMEEETGWKLVHGDVFRPPALPMLLSVFVGTGVQTLAMSIITMCFAVLGFLSPANRGGLMTAMLLLFVLMGVPAGYSSAFLHKSLKGTDWKKNIVLTSWYCAQF